MSVSQAWPFPSPAAASDEQGVEKLGHDGKPVKGGEMITPLVVHNGLMYMAGQGPHSRGGADDAKQPDIDTHTRKVLDTVKSLVESGGGSMDSILQLTVYLADAEDLDGMNKVFKTYFPRGGPARTTVAVADLPGKSLVEINGIAAVTRAQKRA